MLQSIRINVLYKIIIKFHILLIMAGLLSTPAVSAVIRLLVNIIHNIECCNHGYIYPLLDSI